MYNCVQVCARACACAYVATGCLTTSSYRQLSISIVTHVQKNCNHDGLFLLVCMSMHVCEHFNGAMTWSAYADIFTLNSRP